MKTVVLTDQARVRVCLNNWGFPGFPTFLFLKSAAYAVHRVKVDSKLIDWANLNFGRWSPFLRSWSCIGSGYASSLSFFLSGCRPRFPRLEASPLNARARVHSLYQILRKRETARSLIHIYGSLCHSCEDVPWTWITLSTLSKIWKIRGRRGLNF